MIVPCYLVIEPLPKHLEDSHPIDTLANHCMWFNIIPFSKQTLYGWYDVVIAAEIDPLQYYTCNSYLCIWIYQQKCVVCNKTA